jgi:hypothetical protein
MNNILYSGTTKEFYDEQIQKEGKYSGQNRIYLTESLWHAIGIARNRAEEYKASPLLLVIQINKISKPINMEDNALITIESLLPSEVLTFENLPSLFDDETAERFERKINELFNVF